MNIFALDYDPILAAEFHCNKHCNKMINESCQMMSTVRRLHGCECILWTENKDLNPLKYPLATKLTHPHHLCTQWVAASKENFDWLLSMTLALCGVYEERYQREHEYYTLWESLFYFRNDIKLPSKGLTPFVQCMPDVYKHSDSVEAYRNFYVGDKSRFARWYTKDRKNNIILEEWQPYWYEDRMDNIQYYV